MWQWVRRANVRLNSDPWSAVRFQPILYFFMFGAAIRLWHKGTEPAAFEEILQADIYSMWLFLAVASPLAALTAWWMTKKLSGRWRYIGMWLRLASTIGAVTVMMAYHAVSAFSGRDAGETQIFARYMVGSILIFLCALMIRDVWTMVITERVANQIHRDQK